MSLGVLGRMAGESGVPDTGRHKYSTKAFTVQLSKDQACLASSFFLIHRKDKIRPSPAHPGNNPPSLHTHPSHLKKQHSKKILSQYLQAHPLWATFSLLWRGDKIHSSELPSVGDKDRPSRGGAEDFTPPWRAGREALVT